MTKHDALRRGRFGLERETLRVDSAGRLAQTPHPFTSPHLTRDFCENQLEIVTPVCDSIPEALDALAILDRSARETLSQMGETLWMHSNPPHIESEAEIPIADFSGADAAKRSYRDHLAQRYGKRLMLFCGIHFNISFDEDYIHGLHVQSGSRCPCQDFRTAFYFRLLKQIVRYSWLPLLVSAASAEYDASLDGDGLSGRVLSPWRSVRSGERGYWNRFVPVLDYSGLPEYVRSISRYVEEGQLYSASELYLPVRMKPPGENSLEGLLRRGADHIELRMFDLNPAEPLGIARRDLEFAHLLVCYLTTLPDFDLTPALQAQAIADHKAAARRVLSEITVSGEPAERAVRRILSDMEQFYADDADALGILAECGKHLFMNNGQ